MTRRVVAVVDDMFFASKIRAVAEAVGVEVSFPRSKEALIEKAREAQLIVVDLHNQRFDPIDVAQELRGIPLVGFFSHVETELRRNALAAGFDQVLPRSVFVRDLQKIIESTDYTDYTD